MFRRCDDHRQNSVHFCCAGANEYITQIDILKLVQIKLSSWLDTKEDKSMLFYLIGVNWFFKKMCSLFPAFSL